MRQVLSSLLVIAGLVSGQAIAAPESPRMLISVTAVLSIASAGESTPLTHPKRAVG